MLGSLSNHDDNRVDDSRSNVKVNVQARPKNFIVVPSSTTLKKSSFTSSWTLLSFVIAFNWLEVLLFCVVVLKSFVQFVDYEIDLKSFLPSHRSDSYSIKTGQVEENHHMAQVAEIYLSIFKTLACGLCFLHFAHGSIADCSNFVWL